MIEKISENYLSLKDLIFCMGISESTLFRLKRKNIPPFDKIIRIFGRLWLPKSVYNEWAQGFAKPQAIHT
jgi:predicted DNA-binding transcriptional regulator AlpA